jgi:two-component system nitrate/nitrite response regulator NarL
VSAVVTTTRNTRSIRVVIATGEPLFGDALERVVRQHRRFELVGQACDGVAALELLRAVKADVAVLGPSLEGLEPKHLLEVVGRDRPETRLLFVGDEFGEVAAYELLGGGAAGVLTKMTSPEQLREAILAAAAGREFLTCDMLAAVAREIRLRTNDDRPILTDREREILERIAEGENVPVIARAMHLGISTVKTHRSHLYEKLGVSDRAAAVAVAMRRRLIA